MLQHVVLNFIANKSRSTQQNYFSHFRLAIDVFRLITFSAFYTDFAVSEVIFLKYLCRYQKAG